MGKPCRSPRFGLRRKSNERRCVFGNDQTISAGVSKLHFLDIGLAAWLLGIRDAETLNKHAIRGALFETWVVSELVKQRFNAGQPADLYFWRDNVGHEVDVVFEHQGKLQAIEIKSCATFVSGWIAAARKWTSFAGDDALAPWVVYGGNDSYVREGAQVFGWSDVDLLRAAALS